MTDKDISASIKVRALTRVFSGKGHARASIVANERVSFIVPRGEVFGLLGPNGAGKSTLVHQLLGLVKPTSGEIWIEGVNIVKYPEQATKLIGFLPQTALPLRGIGVIDALHYTGRLRGQTETDARLQANSLAQALGITEFASRPAHRLSGGMLRLINFAMSLMGYPRVLVLDEPTNELDPYNRRLIWDFIAKLNRDYRVTCILVTHNVLEAEKVVQRVAIMQQGHLVALGTPGELKAKAGGKIRLEFTLKDSESLGLRASQRLAQLGELEEIRPTQFRLLINRERVNVLDAALNIIGLERLDDFRLAPPTLEDVYLDLGRQTLLQGDEKDNAEGFQAAGEVSHV